MTDRQPSNSPNRSKKYDFETSFNSQVEGLRYVLTSRPAPQQLVTPTHVKTAAGQEISTTYINAKKSPLNFRKNSFSLVYLYLIPRFSSHFHKECA